VGVIFELAGERVFVRDLINVQALDRGFFGKPVDGNKASLELMPEEALYLMDVRNASCQRGGKAVTFNMLAAKVQGPKFLARYFCYRDWRDRGLVARPIAEAKGPYQRSPVEKYPGKPFRCPKVHSKGLFFYDDLMSVVDDNEEGLKLYEKDWFGQYGTYKANKHGQYLKLDSYETLFLARHGGFTLQMPEKLSKEDLEAQAPYRKLVAELNSRGIKLAMDEKRLVYEAVKRREDFLSLYEVYEDWRLRSFVLKTGFKFGTHFRLYFPGASPALANAEWMHSKHVIHVFPRPSKMLISEWARAIRVAHGVRKTFILAIPGKKTSNERVVPLDFLLYHRKPDGIETPRSDSPKFVMLALSEEEEIGGAELASAIAQSKRLGLDLILSICDRETSVTHYRVKRIELPGSDYEYYEIEWIQP
jgi:tRNA-intron endonuclease